MDASFLYMETPNVHMHVTGVLVLDPSAMDGEYSFERIRDKVQARLPVLPLMRKRIAPVPFGLDHPMVFNDPDFDIENHVHRITIPAPGTRRELAQVVGDVSSRPIDRSLPLWEMWVVEGAEDGTVSLVTKIQHSMIDGVTGADLMSKLLDLEPDATDPEDDDFVAEHVPGDAELVAGSFTGFAANPARGAKAFMRTGRSLAGIAGTLVGWDPTEGPGPALPFMAPRTTFTAAITPHRAIAFGQAQLDDMRFIKSTFGVKVNDVVLAAVTRTLRYWLDDHDDLPDGPLVCSVPVSVHGAGDDDGGTNQVSAMFVRLPVHLEDPVQQLMAVHDDTQSSKVMSNAIGADLLRDLTQFAPPAVFNQAVRLYSSSKLADRHRPIHNLVVSNVPGPPVPLYCAGARVVAVYPFGPVLEGAGINITVLSNMGNVDFGIISCRELVPDLWDIAEGFGSAVLELRAAAERQVGAKQDAGVDLAAEPEPQPEVVEPDHGRGGAVTSLFPDGDGDGSGNGTGPEHSEHPSSGGGAEQ
jgi:WS/DGAT/MGAT family acyltransferase